MAESAPERTLKVLGETGRNRLQVSEHLGAWEIACRCKAHCGGAWVFHPKLFRYFERGRQLTNDLFGRDREIPLIVNSGYRCKAWNEQVGGHPRSRHLFGEAFDLVVPGGLGALQWAKVLKRVWPRAAVYFDKKRNGYWPYVHVDLGLAGEFDPFVREWRRVDRPAATGGDT
ncbi:MAG: hypothetical protein KAW17_09670 [Candidatus Eisenbacteria sp.]|nr:hypothetical protein [Candidatus Eisenbacteria bacterium]